MLGRWFLTRRLLRYFSLILTFIILLQTLSTLLRVPNIPPNVQDQNRFFRPIDGTKKPERKRRNVKVEPLPPRVEPTWLVKQQSTNATSSGHYRVDEKLCRVYPGDGSEGRRGYQALNKIRHNLTSRRKQQQQQQWKTSSRTSSSESLRLLCVVFTNSNHHDNVLTSVMDTYAPRCHGVMALSNATDLSRGIISLVSSWDKRNANNSNAVGWNRIRRAFQYVNEYYQNEYDFFHFASDDTYVVVDNLLSFLSRVENNSIPLFLGALMPMTPLYPRRGYCDGRAGFTLNRPALLRIATKFSGPSSACGKKSLPLDQRLADCLYRDNIICADTSDRDRGARYHPFLISVRSKLFPDDKNSTFPWYELSQYHQAPARGGNSGISPETVSFRSLDHHRYHAIFYDLCDFTWEKHRGALDEKGRPGYVHNATFLKHHPLPFNYEHGDCNLPFGNGTEGATGYKGLQKIQISTTTTNVKKVLCMVYTHSNRHDRIRAIAETYGPRCDGFFASSNLTNQSIGAVHILHEGPEAYSNMWLKVRAMWEYTYDHYLHEFDFFMIGGDDYYVVAANLKHLISTGSCLGPWNHSQPLFLGGSSLSMPYVRRHYCGGGAGYTLNRAALQLLIEKLWRTPACWPHHYASDDDRIVAGCLETAGIRCSDTNDERNETSSYRQNRPSSSLFLHANELLTLASTGAPDSSFAWVYMALLALQFGCQPLLTRAYTPKSIIRSTVVAAQEVVKLLSCLAALMITQTWTSSTEGWTLASWWLGAGIPATLYVIQSYCALIAYQHLPAVTFNVLNQTKTLSAALFCYFILGRKQSYWQVVALVLLLGAGLIIERVLPLPDIVLWRTTTHTDSSTKPLLSSSSSSKSLSSQVVSESASSSVIDVTTRLIRKSEEEIDMEKDLRAHTHLTKGVLPVLMASLISGLSGSLSQRSLQIWDRNSYLFSLELSTASLLVLGASTLLGSPDGQRMFQRRVDGDTESSFLERIGQGWTWKTWIPITTNALGSVLVGLVTKYSGSVQKGFALIFGLLLSGILQNNLARKSNGSDDDSSSSGVSKEQVIGGCLAALSLWLHSNFPYVTTPHL